MTRQKVKGTTPEDLANVAQLLKEPVGSNRSLDIDEAIAGQVKGSVKGKVTLIRSGRGILVRGAVAAEVELICSRCLDPFLCPISFNIEEEFFSTVDISSGLSLSLPEEADGFTIDSNHMLNLGELMRQYILLSLPMKPLCRPDCAGIKEMSLHGST